MARRAPFRNRASGRAKNLLKDLDAKIRFQQENPKLFGSASYQRYKEYCRATTVREALHFGAWKGDIRNDAQLGFLTRGPKSAAKKLTKNKTKEGKIMGGIVKDGNGKYSAEREFCFFSIRAQNLKTVEHAQASLKAIDRVQENVQSRIIKKVVVGEKSSLDDFTTFVRQAVAKVRRDSPDLGVEKWRYFARHSEYQNTFSASSLRLLRKDPQISIAIKNIRFLTDTLEKVLPGWLKLAKAAGLKEMSDVKGIEGLTFGRRAADELAREELERLKEGKHPSDAVVLKALRLWGFDKSKSRPNVMPKGYEWVHSDTLGIIEDWHTHNMIISSPCNGHENFVRLLSSWARKRSPNKDLPFTTISLNKNYGGRLHRDSGNIGPSIGVATGQFTGGGLRFWPTDSKRGTRSANVEQVRKEPNMLLNIKEGVVFDGNCAHEVEPFQGERYSMIFFTVKKYKQTSPAVKRKMINMGADWPTTRSLKRLHANIPRSA